MNPKSVFISGSNRGIGLEFVKQLLNLPKPPDHIFAACRNPTEAKQLQELAEKNNQVHLLKLDVKDHSQYDPLVKQVEAVVGNNGLNVLINNAGMIVRDSLDNVTPEQMREVLEVNMIAPLFITKAFLPLLKAAASKSSETKLSCSRAAVINITSKMGSLDDNGSGRYYTYRTSKAALNMFTKSLSVDLLPAGILALALHPGWVQTDMGGPNGLINTQTSVEGMLTVMAKSGKDESGLMLAYDGQRIPW